MEKFSKWSREETIIAFNVYCKIPFKNSSKNHEIIIKYAKILGRTPSALNMKIGNFGRLDPELKLKGISGLKNGSKTEELVWNEFYGNWEKLAFESEELISKFENKTIVDKYDLEIESFPEGKERDSIIKCRINQSFFRSTILSSYNSTCCITGLTPKELLIASHIVPWSIDEKNRTNPHNGLCLNPLHDKAFDKGFITITTDYKVKLSNKLKELIEPENSRDFFLKYENKKIILPDKFLPSKEFLNFHNYNIFLK